MLAVRIVHAGNTLRFPLEGSASLGSSPQNEIQIESRQVSRHHVRLHLVGDLVEVEDLSSLNGTFLDARRIRIERRSPPFEITLGQSVRVVVEFAPTDDLRLAPGMTSAVAPARLESRRTEPRETTESTGLGAALLRAISRVKIENRSGALLECIRKRERASFVGLFSIPHMGESWTGNSIIHELAFGDTSSLPDLLEAVRSEGVQGGAPGSVRLEGVDVSWTAVASSEGLRLVLIVGAPEPVDLTSVTSALRLLTPKSPPPLSVPENSRTTLQLGREGEDMVECQSRVMTTLHERMMAAVSSDLRVLLLGETGTGKEVYARALHEQSRRRDAPFRAVNSCAIPEDLLEATLFGVEKGAATGVRAQVGLLRDAQGGTFFLDEIGEMSMKLQAKLLRVLDECRVLPLGGVRSVPLDVRFIAATNRDLEAAVEAGEFRADLLYRLRGHEFQIPPLHEHIEDLPLYVNHFMRVEASRLGKHVTGLTVAAMGALKAYPWPGNVREVEAIIRRLVHEIPAGQPISLESLPPRLRPHVDSRISGNLERRVDALKTELVREALADCDGNRSRAAERLGMSRGGLRKLMIRLDVS